MTHERAANAITTVSPWHAEFIRQFNPNVSVVYNGYDAAQFYPQDIPSERFTITYIGSLFEWQKPALAKVKQAIEGMDVVNRIAETDTDYRDRPLDDQRIKSMTVETF